jgi:hypothetical protein
LQELRRLRLRGRVVLHESLHSPERLAELSILLTVRHGYRC